MRKYLILAAALALLLCGCSNDGPELTDPTVPKATGPQEYYIESSDVETQTQGAVREYSLPQDILWIKMAGEQLLLGTESGVQILEGDRGTVVASSKLDASYPDHWQVLDEGFAYYDMDNNNIQLLDAELNRESEIILNAEMASPIVSPDAAMVYYCTEQEIRIYEVQNKISKPLKTHSCASQRLVGSFFDGQILACSVVDDAGEEKIIYISAENGSTLSADEGIRELYADSDKYLAVRDDGTVLQQIVGQLNGDAKLINAPDDSVAGVLALDSVLGYGFNEENALVLNLYNVTSETRTATAVLGDFNTPSMVLSDGDNGCIWLLTGEPEGETEILLRWKPSETLQDETSYFSKLHTSASPDKSGLEKLNDRVSALNSKYGVRIRIWQEAVKVTEGYNLQPEHQVEAISQVLDDLEAVFKEFPGKFIYKSISSRVRICVVRSIDNEVKATQFWSGKYAFIVLSPGVDVRSEFLKGFGFVVDSHVLGNSPLYDYWEALNPEGFTYGSEPNEALTEGESRAFADIESMTSVTMDRSRIFWYATQPDNAEMFKSETMQSKLQLLCKAIRDAWGLEKKTDTYLWEQYLDKPIAAKK